ncbi:MAG: hypothetical protein ACREBJ_00155 [Nitrosotalea sp.]
MEDKVVAEAVRIEYEEKTGKLYIVFEVKDEKYKQDIKANWTKDIEYKLVDRFLVQEGSMIDK